MIRIREVYAEDELDALTELHQETFAPGEAPMADFTEGYWWLAHHKETPIAFLGVRQSTLGPDVGYFTRVGVLTWWRGYGLQLRLMRAMHAKAKRVGWTRIVTDTLNNPPSANNIIRAGYRMFEPDAPWSLAGALYWTKEIT